jgi:hypothetical protein
MKYLFSLNTWLAANLIGLVSLLVPKILIQIPYLEPISDSVLEWDFTDLAYRDFDGSTVEVDSNIVLVNFGYLDRYQIAGLIDRINQHKPAVV